MLGRIHNELTIAPSLPIVKPTAPKEDPIASNTDAEENALSGQVEIAYVPPEERQEALKVDDALVVVGQKKRKRGTKISKQKMLDLPDSQSLADHDGTPGLDVIEDTQATGLSTAPDVAPFDFEASGSNILDDGSDHEVEPASRKKKRKGQSGTFIPLPCYERSCFNSSHRIV